MSQISAPDRTGTHHAAALRRLARQGQAVDCAQRAIPVSGRNTLWLVTEGALDLFAVDDPGDGGQWHFVGKLERGTILLPPGAGPRHTLVLRPLEGAHVRRLSFRELVSRHKGDGQQAPVGQDLRAEADAIADGADRGLAVFLEFLREGLPPRDFVPLVAGTDIELTAGQSARSIEGLVWVDVVRGRLESNGHSSFRDRESGDSAAVGERCWISTTTSALVKVRSSRQLMSEGHFWQHLLQTANTTMYMVDRAVERQEHLSERKILAGRDATRAAAEHATRSLQAVLMPAVHLSRSGTITDDDATSAACRLVADEMGITVADSSGEPANHHIGPVERIAVRSRFRTRTVTLKDQWWRTNIGPLVGYRRQGHAPVALLWRRGRYQAVDAVTGERNTVSHAEAAAYEERAVMFYQPLPDTVTTGWRLLRYGLRGSGGDVWTMAVSALIAVGLTVLVPFSTGKVLGTFIPAAESTMIVQLCVGLLVAAFASAAFGALQNLALLRVEGRFESILQAAVWDRLLRLPTDFFKRYSTGELASAALGIENIRAVLMDVSSTILYSTTLTVVNFVVLFWFSIPLALLATLFLAVGVGVFLAIGSRQMVWQTKSLQMGFVLTDRVFQTLRGLPKLRVANAADRAYANWAKTFSAQKEVQKRIGRYQNVITVFNAAYLPLCTLFIFVAISGPLRGGLSIPAFLAFNSGFALMLNAVIQITSSITSTINIIPIMNRLKPILEEPLETAAGSTPPGEMSGDIEVNHLSFAYSQGSAPVLSDISFHIRAGDMVAVVGPSGCGKSTLLRLLLGFEKPLSGSILYDGQDLSSLDLAAVRRQCGVVLQQAKPFTGSIMQAITGAQNYTIDDAWAAAEMAGLRGDIEAMPMGMHTLIGDGSTLSGGQRQRLVIAQALIRRPRILFFDEATSALDNETQRIVTESTRRLRGTRVVIAHRLSTVMDADQVVVLSQGRVAQHGTPAELLADEGGIFHHLVQRQIQ
ncbi:NHLP bacteriocin export ABC transporter permease/ATPase subunit [Streptomyces sp. NPDC006539]|uniref:NHLP bacteriocin export ABC transporter permease/ATPase subunit n=1 Tax=Streptomyces sp. NPDC006539 TaxID=3155352 RepID=UPI0033B26AC6